MKLQPRVRLRRLAVEDATPAYARWFRDGEVRRWITHATPTVRKCRGYILKALADPNVMLWGIFMGEQHVGNIKATLQVHGTRAILGLLIGFPSWRGIGIGPRAIRQAARWCFKHWNVAVVAAGVHPFNTRSMRVFEKSGFQIAEPDPPRIWLHLEKP